MPIQWQPKRKGTNPLLNEQAILNTLRNEEIPITPNGMRSLMSLTLIAMYDRGVEREFFADALDDCAMIGIDLADLEKAGAMRGLLGQVDPEKTPELVDAEINKLVQGFMAKRRRLANKLHLTTQCPTAADPVS